MKNKILDKEEISRIINRMAYEILERNLDIDNLIMIGIKSRGDVLSKRIAAKIESIEKKKIPVSPIDITFYRDDVNLQAYKYTIKHEIKFDINNKNIILVDDVIFTGRTARAAIDELIDLGRAKTIQLAVLIDRENRELPIQPDYVGKKIFVSTNEKIIVHLKEIDGEDAVLISKIQ
jgi:pyrimidine operon attenuation protein/uracil phosphoribosyltransferase